MSAARGRSGPRPPVDRANSTRLGTSEPMSRIDEALRRVSGEPIALPQADFERSKNRTAEEILERYPVEMPGPAPCRWQSRPRARRIDRSRRPASAGSSSRIDPEIDGRIVTGHPTAVAIEQYRRLGRDAASGADRARPQNLDGDERRAERGQDAHGDQSGADAQRVVRPEGSADRC